MYGKFTCHVQARNVLLVDLLFERNGRNEGSSYHTGTAPVHVHVHVHRAQSTYTIDTCCRINLVQWHIRTSKLTDDITIQCDSSALLVSILLATLLKSRAVATL